MPSYGNTWYIHVKGKVKINLRKNVRLLSCNKSALFFSVHMSQAKQIMIHKQTRVLENRLDQVGIFNFGQGLGHRDFEGKTYLWNKAKQQEYVANCND